MRQLSRFGMIAFSLGLLSTAFAADPVQIKLPAYQQNLFVTPKLSPAILQKFRISLPLLGCIGTAADAPQKTLSTLCRAVSRCVVLPSGSRDAESVVFDMCLAQLAEGEDRQLWNNLGNVPENALTTSQFRAGILEGRYGVNAPAFCDCMNDISAQTCEQIAGMVSGPADYANFENLIPDTAECEGSFSTR